MGQKFLQGAAIMSCLIQYGKKGYNCFGT